MSTCWKCSHELAGARCDACNALNRVGDTVLNGILRDDDGIVVYLAEDAPGHLVVDLGERAGLVDRLPKPTKKNAVSSKGFVAVWELIVGDHPLLREASPQSFRPDQEAGATLLHIEVHGLPAEPSHSRKSTNGVPADAESAHRAFAEDDDSMDEDSGDSSEDSSEDSEDSEDSDEDEDEAAAVEATAAEVEAAAAEAEAEEMTEFEEVDEGSHAPPTPLPGMELAALPRETAGGLNLHELDTQVRQHVRAGESAEALTAVKKLLDVPDTARRLAENLHLYSLYGRLTAETDASAARDALARAFKLDPRDRGVLNAYGDLLAQSGEDAELLVRVDRNLLLHHRRTLQAPELGKAYRRIGKYLFDQNELDRARVHFEKALDANSADRDALDMLLKTVEAEGDPERVIRVRQRLLEQMRDPAGRAMLRVAIGDDYLSRLNDVHRAIESYEASLAEQPNAPALSRLARIAIEREDWSLAVDTYEKMGEMLPASSDKAEALLQAGKIYRHHLWKPDKAADAFDKSLEHAPDKLESFRELTSLLVEGEQWERLRGAYEDMIMRVKGAERLDRDLLGALYRNLGELLRTQLDDRETAAEAYRAAYELFPGNAELLELLADLYASYGENEPEKLDKAIEYNRSMLELYPDRIEVMERLGILYLRRKQFDPAFCVFRALDFQGRADERAKRFVESYSSNVFRSVNQVMDDRFYRANFYSKDHDHALDEILGIAAEALIELLAHDLEYYGLRAKNRIDTRQGIMFNNIYHEIAAKLAYPEVPPVYEKTDLTGMLNGSLYPPGFLVGGPLLSGRSEKEIAFAVTKQLAMFRLPSFLVQLRPMRDLQVIFYTIVKLFRPEVNITLTADMQRVAKAFQKLAQPRYNRLGEVVMDLMARGQKINLGGIIESFEDAANRCALLFCDDLNVCKEMLLAEPLPVNPARTIEERMQVLLQWSGSAEYHALRQRLGMTIDA